MQKMHRVSLFVSKSFIFVLFCIYCNLHESEPWKEKKRFVQDETNEYRNFFRIIVESCSHYCRPRSHSLIRSRLSNMKKNIVVSNCNDDEVERWKENERDNKRHQTCKWKHFEKIFWNLNFNFLFLAFSLWVFERSLLATKMKRLFSEIIKYTILNWNSDDETIYFWLAKKHFTLLVKESHKENSRRARWCGRTN